MHEGNFTQEIVDAVLREVKKYPGTKTGKVRVRVGEMLHLDEDSVKLHYENLTRGTDLEGSALEMKEIPVMIRCEVCGHEGGVEDHHLLMCSQCEGSQVRLLSGQEVVIEQLEVEPKA